MTIDIEHIDIGHCAYLVVNRIDDAMPAPAPVARADHPALILDDITFGIPRQDVYSLA